MKKIQTVFRYTIKEHVRHRIYLAVFLFGLIMIAGSAIVASLALEERMRVLVNLGLAGMEFIALLSIVFVTVNLILSEIESKSIYLILSHPIHRWEYVLGRFLGTYLSILFGMVLMALLHLGVLSLQGWNDVQFYFVAWVCSAAKISVIGSLALLISLITTSTASSMILTSFLWVMGHFSSELKFLAERSASAWVEAGVAVFYYVTPDFSIFNYRDYHAAVPAPGDMWLAWLVFYALSYTTTMLYLSSWIFSKREV